MKHVRASKSSGSGLQTATLFMSTTNGGEPTKLSDDTCIVNLNTGACSFNMNLDDQDFFLPTKYSTHFGASPEKHRNGQMPGEPPESAACRRVQPWFLGFDCIFQGLGAGDPSRWDSYLLTFQSQELNGRHSLQVDGDLALFRADMVE